MDSVFALPYLGNIEFYRLYATSSAPVLDLGEHYVKQSHRSRAVILGANGLLALTVPVLRKGRNNQPMSQTSISYETDWQRVHIEAIRSAYGSSPFFEHYFDEIADCIRTRYDLLAELSLALHQQILSMLGIADRGRVTYEYCSSPDIDYRSLLQPKNSHEFHCPRYTQVFSDKYGFQPNLSIIDLFFCEGPSAADILIV